MSNKDLVIKAMTALFVNRDLTAIDKYWDEEYIQHNPDIQNGQEILRDIMGWIKTDFKYELSLVIGEGEYVMVHGRYTGWSEKPMVAIEIFRVKNGKFIEHWDVMQEEVPAEMTASKNAMFPVERNEFVSFCQD
jgi:predicted SnoaL-like aldol condensation-catalyzing enzyme